MNTEALSSHPDDGEVHLWQWSLAGDAATVDGYSRCLSAGERERTAAFRFQIHRHRFIMARGRLRLILASYLGCEAGEIIFGYGPAGKPYCAPQPGGRHLHFNLSHSGDHAALAISCGFELGVDIEQRRPVEEDILPQIFSKAERRQYDALSPADRQVAFIDNWTRKEACLKALGTGLQLAPDHFEFNLAAGNQARLERVGGNADEARHWQVVAFETIGPCAGTIAARAKGWLLVEQHLPASAR
jgi:4'-phosphopantetheinyl transferase